MEPNKTTTGTPTDIAEAPIKKKNPLATAKRELAQNEKQQQQKREQVERLTAEIAALEEQHETLQKTVRTLETEELTFQVKRLLNEGSLSPHDVMQLVNEAKPSKSKRKKAAAPAASDTTGTEESQ